MLSYAQYRDFLERNVVHMDSLLESAITQGRAGAVKILECRLEKAQELLNDPIESYREFANEYKMAV